MTPSGTSMITEIPMPQPEAPPRPKPRPRGRPPIDRHAMTDYERQLKARQTREGVLVELRSAAVRELHEVAGHPGMLAARAGAYSPAARRVVLEGVHASAMGARMSGDQRELEALEAVRKALEAAGRKTG